MVRVFIPDNTLTTGAGLTGLSSSSTNLVIGYMRQLDASWTEYTQAAGNIEAQTTIGTYQAPSTSSKCRFKEIGYGFYEMQFHNDATIFGSGDASDNVIINIRENSTTALKIGPNAIRIPLSLIKTLDGEANTIQLNGTALTPRDIGASVLVGDKTGFSLSATGADLILKSSTFVQAIVAAINEFATYGLTALNTLLTSTGIKATSIPDATLAASQPNYAPAKAGDKMDLVDAPNSTAVGVIQSGLATLSKMLKYFQLLFRKDAGIKSDNSTEFTAVNADEGSGAGSYDNVTDSVQALRDDLPIAVEQHIINETDGEAVLTAITDKIASVNPDLSGLTLEAIADAVRTELATELAHLNADITSRSSHSAADVWAVTVRTLSAFGFTVSINSNGDITAIKEQTDKIGDASKGLVKVYDDMAKDATVSKPGTAQTITPPADMALNSTVAKESTLTTKIPTALSFTGANVNAESKVTAQPSDMALNSTVAKDATVAKAATALSNAVWTDEKAGFIDQKISEIPAPPTKEAIADQVWDELAEDHTVSGSMGKIIGAYLPGTGSGSVTFIYTLTDSATGVAIPDADVRVSSDISGETIVASSVTNSYGQVTFLLDPGTYYFWRTKTGWTFTDPDVEVVVSP